MTGKILIAIGIWLLSDAIYSITLYLNAPSYDGKPKQTLKHDHWVRILRGCLAIVVVIIGGYL